mgnify:CR=1 FL=1
MNLTRVILSACAVASSVVCLSAYSIASSEPAVSFTSVKPCAKETAVKSKVEILEPLGPLHDIAEPDILEAFKSRVSAMKASGEYDRRFNQNKDRIVKELEHPTQVTGLKKTTELRVWELSASVPETLPESLLRQARFVPMPHLSRSLLFIDGTDAESLEAGHLRLHLLFGVGTALGHDFFLRKILTVFLFDLNFNRHTVAVPARYVRSIKAFQCSGFKNDVLQNLVDCVADVNVSVGIGRAVMQKEALCTFACGTNFAVHVLF